MGVVYEEYYAAVLANSCEVADENFEEILEEHDNDFDDAWESFYDDIFIDDSVTDNGSGSYWFNSRKAEKSLEGFLWDEDIVRLLGESGDSIESIISRGPEVTDVIIRCDMLGEVYSELYDYVWKKFGSVE